MNRPSISLRTYFRRLPAWLAILFLLVAVIFAPFAWIEHSNATLLARDGIDTLGVVIEKDSSTSRNSNGSTRRNYYLTVQYQAPDGRSYSGRRSVSLQVYEATQIGAQLPVRHSASRPDVSEPAAGDTRRTATLVLMIAGGFLLGGLVSLWFLRRGIAGMRRALDGERRVVPVLAHHKVGKRASRSHAIEWRDGVGSQRTVPVNERDLPPVGSEIVVYIDPRTNKGYWEREF